jgi:hypothetical protein
MLLQERMDFIHSLCNQEMQPFFPVPPPPKFSTITNLYRCEGDLMPLQKITDFCTLFVQSRNAVPHMFSTITNLKVNTMSLQERKKLHTFLVKSGNALLLHFSQQ